MHMVSFAFKPTTNLGQPLHCFPAVWLKLVHMCVLACTALQAASTTICKRPSYISLLYWNQLHIHIFKRRCWNSWCSLVNTEINVTEMLKQEWLGGIDWKNQCYCLCWLLCTGIFFKACETGLRRRIADVCDQPPESLRLQETGATPLSTSSQAFCTFYRSLTLFFFPENDFSFKINNKIYPTTTERRVTNIGGTILFSHN